jgi:hypothetical protein
MNARILWNCYEIMLNPRLITNGKRRRALVLKTKALIAEDRDYDLRNHASH